MRPRSMIPVFLVCGAAACQGRPAPPPASSSPGEAPPTAAVESAAGTGAAPGRETPVTGAPTPIRADREAYTLRRRPASDVYEARARITYTNHGSRPVYMQVCRGADAPHVWVVTAGPEAASVGLTAACPRSAGVARIAVPPGGSRADSVQLVTTASQRPPEGTYRFEADLYDRPGQDAAGRLPADRRRSGTFRIRYED